MIQYSVWYSVPYSEQTFLHIIVYFGILINHASGIIEMLTTKEKQFNFWNTLLTIEKTFLKDERNKIEEANRKLKKKLTWRLCILSIFAFSCKMILIVTNRVLLLDPNWVATEVISLWAQECVRLNFFTHFIFVEILRMHVELYNEKTKDITSIARKINEKALLSELNILKIRHSLIWKLNRHLNSFFQWAQTLNCLLYFFHITNLTYWIYNGINTGKFENRECSKSFFSGMLVIFTLSVITLINLIYSCEMLKEATNKTPPLIHEISEQVLNPFDIDVHDAVMAISMQIHHEKIFITYGGFFNVDMTLLTTISATITTYLVIFIQFIG
uniref:Gustatory receptor n=1 Tax=Lutzomyia longipalpis TaxID=7200 RepID=A0A7G3A8X2_LUTLO